MYQNTELARAVYVMMVRALGNLHFDNQGKQVFFFSKKRTVVGWCSYTPTRASIKQLHYELEISIATVDEGAARVNYYA